MFKCEICLVSFTRSDNLKRHSVKHNSKLLEEQTVTCIACKKQFLRKDLLKRHFFEVHDVQITFECEICRRSFVRKSNMQRHMKSQHREKKISQIQVRNDY